jgi:hypothetical protein
MDALKMAVFTGFAGKLSRPTVQNTFPDKSH